MGAYKQILEVNDMFRESVLGYFSSNEPFAAPCLDPQPAPGMVQHKNTQSGPKVFLRSLTRKALLPLSPLSHAFAEDEASTAEAVDADADEATGAENAPPEDTSSTV